MDKFNYQKIYIFLFYIKYQIKIIILIWYGVTRNFNLINLDKFKCKENINYPTI